MLLRRSHSVEADPQKGKLSNMSFSIDVVVRVSLYSCKQHYIWVQINRISAFPRKKFGVNVLG